MFGYYKDEMERLQKIIDTLEQENDDLDTKLSNKTFELKRLLDRNAREVSECTPAIAFEQMEVVSIERILHKDGNPVTIVGYLNRNQDGTISIREWKLFCNATHHEQLVAEFKGL
jgi:hypothetical protein